MNLGFLGGRFDPVHVGHLGAAQTALAAHRLDRVIFVPTAQVPHQSQSIVAAAADRLAMLRLALAAHPQFEISDFELKQGGVSYTINSVRHFRQCHPRDRLFWIIGSDQVARLHEWKAIAEGGALVEFIVVARPGHTGQSAHPLPGVSLHFCASSGHPFSSTELRDRAKQRRPLAPAVPVAVAAYIARHGLYR